MSDIRFSGIVEEDMSDLEGEVFVKAGERVSGYLNYYESVPYILGKIEDVDPEYVAPEFWVPVLPESIEVEMFGTKIPFARLRELAEAEREGRVVVMPCKKEQTDRKKGNYMTLKDILSRTVFGTKVLVRNFANHDRVHFLGVHERGGIEKYFDGRTLSSDVLDIEIEDGMIVIGIAF